VKTGGLSGEKREYTGEELTTFKRTVRTKKIRKIYRGVLTPL
jgi:hypothetical protein